MSLIELYFTEIALFFVDIKHYFSGVNKYEIVGNSAYIIFTASFLFKDIIHLRIATILGCVVLLFYAYNISEKPLWTIMIWNALFLLINLIHILILLRERYGINFTKQEKEIYPYFSTMPRSEFKKLIKITTLKQIQPKSNIIKENQEVNKLMFIIQGDVSIFKSGQKIDTFSTGHFIGEMAYITNKTSSATVVAVDGIELLEWSFSDINKLFIKNKNIRYSLLAILAKDMHDKLQKSYLCMTENGDPLKLEKKQVR